MIFKSFHPFSASRKDLTMQCKKHQAKEPEIIRGRLMQSGKVCPHFKLVLEIMDTMFT